MSESGEFAFKVGMPGKSGVGRGIVAFQPGKYSVAVWGPRLNAKGDSVLEIEISGVFCRENVTEWIFQVSIKKKEGHYETHNILLCLNFGF